MAQVVAPSDFRSAAELSVVVVEQGVGRLEAIEQAMREGEYGLARLRFLRVSDETRGRLLQRIARGEAVALLMKLSNFMVVRLLERLPVDLAEELRAALPENKRVGIAEIRHHHRACQVESAG